LNSWSAWMFVKALIWWFSNMHCSSCHTVGYYFIYVFFHILGSDYAESAWRNMGDVTITQIISMLCRNSYQVSACHARININVVTMKKYVTTNRSTVILSWFTTVILLKRSKLRFYLKIFFKNSSHFNVSLQCINVILKYSFLFSKVVKSKWEWKCLYAQCVTTSLIFSE
jgi:hypothetical protein